MSEEDKSCKICLSIIEPDNPTNICLSCQRTIENIEKKIDEGFKHRGNIKEIEKEIDDTFE